MKSKFLLSIFFIFINIAVFAQNRNQHYITNQAPLVIQPYTALPLGAIQPKGWLRKMLETQRDGLTGNLDSTYAVVCGPDNGWLGGTGDVWERGPYWIDGLMPLAYLLNDKKLIAKTQEWVEWSIQNQRADGYFGPYPFDPKTMKRIPGTQQGLSEDWWPKMVMLKALQQYYTATNDERVITLMTNYFHYQLKNLPEKPLGKYTFWAEQRGADNLQVVYWLYNITREKYLLELAEIIHQQTHDWTTVFTDNTLRKVNPYPDLHCVNVAQGIKAPVIYYQQHPEEKYKFAVKEGLSALKDVHGFVNGMYGADEAMHGNDPTQGSEFCSAVELMYSFESVLPITGDPYYADYLEKIAFNVLPTQHDDGFNNRQYFQQVNQIKVTNAGRNFGDDREGRLVYGVTTGYPCCLTNMHQGYPKFVQNMWYATADNGVAALVYGASNVKIKVANGQEIEFSEKTNYPFDDTIKFSYLTNKSATFPLHLRIPGWCEKPVISVNGKVQPYNGDKIIVLNRTWNKNDVVTLQLPMKVKFSEWYEKSIGVERGPLVYAMTVGDTWQEVKTDEFPDPYHEVRATTAWNYGISINQLKGDSVTVETKKDVAIYPWNVENAPITLKIKGRQIPFWEEYHNSTGKLPYPTYPYLDLGTPLVDLTLIPYGCTTLRIAQFPVVDKFK